jgi:putative endonuclease
MQRDELGRAGEDLAASFLARAGFEIVDRNVRYREGEIDLVVARGGLLVFVEVKARRSRAFGSPAEAVTFRKAARIRRLAVRYLAERRPRASGIRFDVVEVAQQGDSFRVTHLEDAF